MPRNNAFGNNVAGLSVGLCCDVLYSRLISEARNTECFKGINWILLPSILEPGLPGYVDLTTTGSQL